MRLSLWIDEGGKIIRKQLSRKENGGEVKS